MEESVNWQFDVYMQEMFHMKEVDLREYSPLTLAYIGDCIYDVIIKSLVVNEGNQSVNVLHKKTSAYVQASTQSKMMRTMQEHLTEEEHAVYKRGRNAKSVSPAKNQSITDYRRATGFEALLGYLYLKKDYKRLLDLVKLGLESLEEKKRMNRKKRQSCLFFVHLQTEFFKQLLLVFCICGRFKNVIDSSQF